MARKWSADLTFALAMGALAILSLIWALFGFVAKSLAEPDCGRSSSLRWSLRAVGLSAGLLLLAVRGASEMLPVPPQMAMPTAITNSNFKTACDAWVADPTTATTTYGAITGWDVSAVSSMARVCPLVSVECTCRPPLLPHLSSV